MTQTSNWYPGRCDSWNVSLTWSTPPWVWSDYTTGLSELVPPPGPFTVSLAGHDYVVDTSFEPYRRDAFRHRSIPPQREGIQITNIPGEGTINPDGLWRRGQEDWNLGSGQTYLDRKLSVHNRFYQSQGVDPWTKWQLSLLHDTEQKERGGVGIFPDGSSLGADIPYQPLLKAIGVGRYVYILTASRLFFTSDWNTYTDVSGGPFVSGVYWSDITTDGNNVYVSTVGGDSGIYTTTAGSTTCTQLVTNFSFTIVRWVNQRLMAAGIDSAIYNITSATPAPAPTALYIHPNSAWRWVDFTYGSSQIYAAGAVPGSGPSSIFRIGVGSDSTTLTIPVQALPLEGGEYATSLGSYLNYVFVGTNLGVRMCQTLAAYDPSGNLGDLRSGALIPNLTQPVNGPVTGIVGNGRYVYFAWNDYAPNTTGIGRLDLENFIDALTPSYASDLMCPEPGTIVLDWDPITNGPLMSVQGQQGISYGGLWTMDPEHYVGAGYVDSGYIQYDLPDDKVAMEMVGQVLPPLGGGVVGEVSVDQALTQNYRPVGQLTTGAPSTFQWSVRQLRGTQFQARLTMTPSADRKTAPTLSHWAMKSYAAISTGMMISVVLIMHRETVEKDLLRPFDPYAEYDYLEQCRQDQRIIQYVEGPFMKNGVITQLDWLPNIQQYGGDRIGYNAYLIVYLKTLPVESS